MGPHSRYLGCEVPREELVWQDPVPAVDHVLADERDVAALEAQVLGTGLTVTQLVATAWSLAATFRSSDKRDGADGARIRLAPQEDWAANQPAQLAQVLHRLHGIQESFNAAHRGAKKISLAPRADGFRDYQRAGDPSPAEELLLDRAQRMTLTASQMSVLVGGLRVLGANASALRHGVFTHTPGVLTNDFFVNLLDRCVEWRTAASEGLDEGRDYATGQVKWTGTRADLVFGSNAGLRALAEVYASDDNRRQFVDDFVAAWDKVMNLDRFKTAWSACRVPRARRPARWALTAAGRRRLGWWTCARGLPCAPALHQRRRLRALHRPGSPRGPLRVSSCRRRARSRRP